MSMTIADEKTNPLRLRVYVAEHGTPDRWLAGSLWVALLTPRRELIEPGPGDIIPSGIELLSRRWALPGGAIRKAARSIGAKPHKVKLIAEVATDEGRLSRSPGRACCFVAASVFNGLEKALHDLRLVVPRADGDCPLMEALRRLR